MRPTEADALFHLYEALPDAAETAARLGTQGGLVEWGLALIWGRQIGMAVTATLVSWEGSGEDSRMVIHGVVPWVSLEKQKMINTHAKLLGIKIYGAVR